MLTTIETIRSLCTDVPPPSENIGGREVCDDGGGRGRLYTG